MLHFALSALRRLTRAGDSTAGTRNNLGFTGAALSTGPTAARPPPAATISASPRAPHPTPTSWRQPSVGPALPASPGLLSRKTRPAAAPRRPGNLSAADARRSAADKAPPQPRGPAAMRAAAPPREARPAALASRRADLRRPLAPAPDPADPPAPPSSRRPRPRPERPAEPRSGLAAYILSAADTRASAADNPAPTATR